MGDYFYWPDDYWWVVSVERSLFKKNRIKISGIQYKEDDWLFEEWS